MEKTQSHFVNRLFVPGLMPNTKKNVFKKSAFCKQMHIFYCQLVCLFLKTCSIKSSICAWHYVILIYFFFFCVCAKFFSSLFTTHASHCLFLLSVNIYSFQFFFCSVVISSIVLIRLEYLLSMSFVVIASVFFALKMVNMNNHVIILFLSFFMQFETNFVFSLSKYVFVHFVTESALVRW